jgi:RNA polymerase sigma factor (sigma-70 family)
MKFHELSEEEIIANLRIKNENIFDKVYANCKTYAIAFLVKNGASLNDAEDIYQDANIVLYQNLQKPEFTLSCSIQTYLNSICRNQWLKRIKGMKKYVSIPEGFEFDDTLNDWFDEFEKNKEEQIQKIESKLVLFQTSEGKCFEILNYYFFKNKSMEDIAKILGYTNGDNVKNQKSRCQKKLKELVMNL